MTISSSAAALSIEPTPWGESLFEPSEVIRLVDSAFSSSAPSVGKATTVATNLLETWEVNAAISSSTHPTEESTVKTPRPLPGPQEVDEEFVVSDEAGGAPIETTENIVEAVGRILNSPTAAASPQGIERDLLQHVPHLDLWEVDAFQACDGAAAESIRTMVAERLRIITFDAARRREVGREAAMHVSMVYLDEATKTLAHAQTVANELIREVNLMELRNLSYTRSKLFATAAELRSFVAHVQSEIAGETTSGADAEPADPFGTPTEVAFFSVGDRFLIDSDILGTDDAARPASNSGVRTSTRSTKTTSRARKAERSAASAPIGKVVVFASSVLVLVSAILYVVLDDKIESRYRNRAPEFAEFDASRFSQVMPIQSATKIRDAADVVVNIDWPHLTRQHKEEKVVALFSVLRPSGVSQLYVFDQARQMVASCKNGVVTVIR